MQIKSNPLLDSWREKYNEQLLKNYITVHYSEHQNQY